MPANGNQSYHYLNHMNVDELKEFLQICINSTEENDALVDRILEVIEKRQLESSPAHRSDIDLAWADFQMHYHTDEGIGARLFDERDTDMNTDLLRKRETAGSTFTPSKRAHHHLLRRALLVAAMIAAVVTTLLFSALGEQLFEMVGMWSNDTFSFQSDAPMASNAENGAHVPGQIIGPRDNYQSLQEALGAKDIRDAIVPTWFPDGYALIETIAVPYGRGTKIKATYGTQENRLITITVKSNLEHNSMPTLVREKDISEVETHFAGKINHYFFQNNGKTIAAWCSETVECSIEGELSVEEMKRMVDSIYEREQS